MKTIEYNTSDIDEYNSSDYAEVIVRTLEEHSIEPDNIFTAAAGRDYGQVRSFSLVGTDGLVAVAYGDSGETRYEITGDDDDLSNWLIPDNLDGLDRLINLASVRGIDEVDAAEPDSTNTCVVLISREFYGPRSEISAAMEDDGQREAEFENAEAAQSWIDKAEAGIYYLSHSESARPTYKVVEL
jgi:hypothetical protein